MERFARLFTALLLIFIVTDTHAQCTREQELDMARKGMPTPEINELCGIEHGRSQKGDIIIPDRFVKPLDKLDLFDDGQVILSISKIYFEDTAITFPHRSDHVKRGNTMTGSITLPYRGTFGIRMVRGDSTTFPYMRRTYRLTALDIFLDGQTAKIVVQDAGPYIPE